MTDSLNAQIDYKANEYYWSQRYSEMTLGDAINKIFEIVDNQEEGTIKLYSGFAICHLRLFKRPKNPYVLVTRARYNPAEERFQEQFRGPYDGDIDLQEEVYYWPEMKEELVANLIDKMFSAHNASKETLLGFKYVQPY